MLKTIICDDEPPALDLLADMLSENSEIDLVGTFLSAAEALTSINAGGIDLAFFDVEMPELSGVEAVTKITVDPKPLLIFATAHPEYAVDAFGIDAIDFVLKPFDEPRIAKAIQKASRMLALIHSANEHADEPLESGERKGVLKVKDGGSFHFVPLETILWIEAAGDYSVIHHNGRELAIRKTLSSLQEELDGRQFCRVHRSSIVSKSHVASVKRLAKGETEISLDNGVVVKSSRSYSDAVASLLM